MTAVPGETPRSPDETVEPVLVTVEPPRTRSSPPYPAAVGRHQDSAFTLFQLSDCPADSASVSACKRHRRCLPDGVDYGTQDVDSYTIDHQLKILIIYNSIQTTISFPARAADFASQSRPRLSSG